MRDNKKIRRSLMVFLGVVLASILLAILASSVWNRTFSGQGKWETAITSEGPYVATMQVEGTIQQYNANNLGFATGYQHNWTLNTIDELMIDPDNKGLILFIDSPGGGVYESDELYLKLQEYQNTGRPYYAVMGSMAASGGYYISANADKIFANRNTWTGSIGVTIGTLYDISDFLERYGVKTVTITAGDNKAMGDLTEPLTKEQQEILQSLVDEAYDQFTAIVTEGRGLDPAKTLELADGRIYTAKQAMEHGLIDEIGTQDDAYQDMVKTYHLKNVSLVDVFYLDDSFLGQVLGNVKIPITGNSDASAILQLVKSESGMPVSYLFQLGGKM